MKQILQTKVCVYVCLCVYTCINKSCDEASSQRSSFVIRNKTKLLIKPKF